MPFKIYRSSAGSGKTFTLVREYLRIALGSHSDTAYRGILAITFTNKAAEEMKSRVIDTLRELSDPATESGHMAKLLLGDLGLSKTDLAAKAARVLRSMLHNYADLSISTIDSFSHRVIRTFAQDFGLPVHFEVELDTDRLITVMLDRLLVQVGQDKGVTDALIDLSIAQAEDERSWSIDSVLREMAFTVFNEEGRFQLSAMGDVGMEELIALRRRLKKTLQEDEERAITTAQNVILTIEAQGLEVSHFSGGKNGMAGYMAKVAEGRLAPPNATVLKNLEEGKWHGSKTKSSDRMAVDSLVPGLMEAYETIISLEKAVRVKGLIVKNVYGIALLERMATLTREVQDDEEVLSIGEFNHLIGGVVMREQAPFIYERLGHRYHHFLVDEFQDTNVLQWFNLLPLIDESLATEGLCLVVGDAKQSIYRWRGGEVQQFVELPSVYRPDYLRSTLTADPDMARTLDNRETSLIRHDTHETPLGFNYRTLPEVVDFNNRLFEDLMQDMPEGLRPMYEGAAQQTPDGKTGGRVEVACLRIPAGKKSYPEYGYDTLEMVTEWVRQCIADGYRPGDIAIICRANDRGVQVAQHLISQGLSVVSNDSLLIDSSPHVRLLVNVARFIALPHDTTNLAELVQHLGMVTDREDEVSAWLADVGRGKSGAVRELLRDLFPKLKLSEVRQLPLYSMFDMLRHLMMPTAMQPHLIYFLDAVLEFTRKEGNDLMGFLIHWAEHRSKLSIALTENPQAVRVLSVHKSKGLEFPVVIHPFADYDAKTDRNRVWVEVEEAEAKPLNRLHVKATSSLNDTPFEPALLREQELTLMDMFNMMYVALTRPRERLYVCGRLKQPDEEQKTPTSSAIGFLNRSLDRRGFARTEDDRVVVGEARKAAEAKADTTIHLSLRNTGDPFWNERIAIARPSRSERGDSEARQNGILIHDALAHVRTLADVPLAVGRLVEDGRVRESDAESLQQRITALISRPELSGLFAQGADVRQEADIQMPGGKWLRPDRVVIADGRAVVVDYKTGEKRPEHVTQIAAYRDAPHRPRSHQGEGTTGVYGGWGSSDFVVLAASPKSKA
jgi:ATP-dependent exoDNAse (exonuclease V) beta subunit